MKKLKRILNNPRDIDLKHFKGLTTREQILYVEDLPTMRELKVEKRRNLLFNFGVVGLLGTILLGAGIRACNEHREKTTTLQSDCADPYTLTGDPDLDKRNYENCLENGKN